MIASIILGMEESFNNIKGDIIGVDRGALFCSQIQVAMRYAIGDFDSVSNEEFEQIKMHSEKIVKLSEKKDDTDSEYALRFLIEKGYTEFHLYGGLGGRMDHSLVNLILLKKYNCKIVLYGESNKIQYLTPNTHTIDKEEYTYFSIIVFEPTVISLKGTLYPIKKKKFTMLDTYAVSNEIILESCVITIHSGGAFIIQTSDKK